MPGVKIYKNQNVTMTNNRALGSRQLLILAVDCPLHDAGISYALLVKKRKKMNSG